jgi:ribosomal protein S18 acetylase RimI-like enzyme
VPFVTLDHEDPALAGEILALLRESYLEEARILGLTDFPPLRRTRAEVQAAASTFLGCREAGCLAALVELEDDGAELSVASLVVRPRMFRRGLGTALMLHVMDRCRGRPLIVSTAAGNLPALRLYDKLGFQPQAAWRTPEGIDIVSLRRA